MDQTTHTFMDLSALGMDQNINFCAFMISVSKKKTGAPWTCRLRSALPCPAACHHCWCTAGALRLTPIMHGTAPVSE